MTGMNCAGLSSKWQSFNKLINDLSPSAFFLQETKLSKKQKFNIENSDYTIFRLAREKTGGGGLALGALNDLKPVLLKEGDDETEAISIQIEVTKLKVRLVVGYGACDSDRQAKKLKTSQKERKMKLWQFIENEVIEAETNEQGLIVQIDANAYVGSEIVKNDPKPQNPNGKLFADFLERNPSVIVVNNLDLCKGLITRVRKTIHKSEEAVLDFFLINSLMLPFLVEMKVDIYDKYTLTNHAQNKKNNKSKLSDHRPLILKLNLEFSKLKPQRVEGFNFKSEECQANFSDITENASQLIKCFENDLPIKEQAVLWEKMLEQIFYKTFKKLRISNSKKKSETKTSHLLEERRLLIRKLARKQSPELSLKLSEIDEKIGKENISMHYSHMKSHLSSISESVATHNTKGSWFLIRKVRPKHMPTVPVGKIDNNGKLIVDQVGLKKLYLETFLWRLRDRPIKPELVEIENIKNDVFKAILNICKKKRSPLWTMEDLESVLSSLKKNKCRDPKGLVNELFSTDVAGKDLKKSMLILFNGIKQSDQIPDFMKIADITALYKGKGSKNDLKNERGIFVVSTYRSILMKLLMKDKYQIIEDHMSPSQIGGRKNMNIRNHIWIANSILHDVLKSKNSDPIDIQILDIKQCFDGLWSEDCLSDIFRYGVQDSTINLLDDASKNIQISVKTPVGKTDRALVQSRLVLQGDVWGPTFCATTIDTIGKECLEQEKYLYHYKDSVPIPPLAMLDDLFCVSKCGPESVMLNSYTNYKISSKKLQCGTEKCKKMHVGHTHEEKTCPELTIDGWKENLVRHVEMGGEEPTDTYEGETHLQTSHQEKYLGDIVSDDGKNVKNLTARKNKGNGLVTEISAMLVEAMLGREHFEIAMIVRNAILISSLIFNCETWYGLTKKQIEMLEKVDEQLLRKILDCSSKTPKYLIYLELGIVPIKYLIQSRRIGFLKYILDQEESTLVNKVFKAQENDPKQGDWVTSVKKDLRKLNIKFTMNEIKNMSKFTFKQITKEACEQAALKNLKMQIKTKGNKISYEQLEMQNYLKADSDLNLEEKKMTFKIRTEMTDLKMNMKNKHEKYTCVACEIKDEITNETQEHVYICKNINKEEMAKCEFNEIFSNKRCTENTKYVVERFQRILKCREQIVQTAKKEADKII
jgi:hypothetical protein